MIESLFGSKTRVKLLRLFLTNPNEAYYVREITRLIDEQINSVRRELKNLIAVGIVSSKAVKNQLYYSANPNYKFYKEFRKIFNNSPADSGVKVDDAVADWQTVGEVKLVLESGKLTGNNSEIDLLVVGNDLNKTRLRLLVKSRERGQEPINYMTMSYDDFYYRKSIRDRFVHDIISQKPKVLIDTEGLLTKPEEGKHGN